MAIARDKFDKASTKFQVYSDFLNDLTPHPVVKDIVRYTNEASVNRSIRNLLRTNRGERLYQPDIGSDLQQLLFEPMIDSTGDLIRKFVQNTITNYEPRAKVLNVEVKAYEESNAYSVTIYYMLINKQDPVQLTVTLDRVR
jgi:phage baseplate assembly protein W